MSTRECSNAIKKIYADHNVLQKGLWLFDERESTRSSLCKPIALGFARMTRINNKYYCFNAGVLDASKVICADHKVIYKVKGI